MRYGLDSTEINHDQPRPTTALSPIEHSFRAQYHCIWQRELGRKQKSNLGMGLASWYHRTLIFVPRVHAVMLRIFIWVIDNIFQASILWILTWCIVGRSSIILCRDANSIPWRLKRFLSQNFHKGVYSELHLIVSFITSFYSCSWRREVTIIRGHFLCADHKVRASLRPDDQLAIWQNST